MSFDALAMHAVRDELEATLAGGFVEKVFPLSDLEIGLVVRAQRRDHSLLLSAHPQSARVHLVQGTLRRLSDEVTPFLLLLRKYVREGRLTSFEQPPLERVLRIGVEKRLEDGAEAASALIIEVMGRHSNVILLDEGGTVLDALKRVPPSLSRQRPILPRTHYTLPPAADKLNPYSPLLARQLTAASRQVPPDSALWRLIQEGVAGLGPLSAREVVYRFRGDPACPVSRAGSWQELAGVLTRFFEPVESRRWFPCVVVREGVVAHFAAYQPTQFPPEQVQATGSISEAVERAYADQIKRRPAEALRAPLRAAVTEKLERVRHREESLRRNIPSEDKVEELKLMGQAILASSAQISDGQGELAWEGKSIRLDPRMNPAENAQRYFREYAKARDAARGIPALLERAWLERGYFEQLLALVELADEEGQLRVLSRELAEAPFGPAVGGLERHGDSHRAGTQRHGKGPRDARPGKAPSEPAGAVKRLSSADGSQILVGGSARGNERATFDLATGGDLWLHARGVPGAHVILKTAGREPARETLLEAARIAALHSQARGTTKAVVDYTPRRYVKKVKGGPPGLVTYSQEKTIRVDATEAKGMGDGG